MAVPQQTEELWKLNHDNHELQRNNSFLKKKYSAYLLISCKIFRKDAPCTNKKYIFYTPLYYEPIHPLPVISSGRWHIASKQ